MSSNAFASSSRPLQPDELAGLLGVPFSDEQLAAICAPLEPGVVIAGAGSGKTSVMAARVVWVVAHHGLPAHEVLGLTFTNKAAGELDARIRRALRALTAAGRAGTAAPSAVPSEGRAAAVDPLDEVDLFPTVSTYHAYAGRLVREHGLRLGIEPSARLLADATRYQLAERVIREAEGPFPSLARAVSTLVTDVLDLDSECSEHLVALDEVAAFDRALLAELDAISSPQKAVVEAREHAVVRGYVLELVQAYRDEKRRRMLADFGDQMAWASQLAETVPEVRRSERELFGVVLLDEYQDTSIAQKRLLRGLFGDGHPVTAVGDPFQAIYGWRGASVSNIDRFAQEFPGPHGPARVFTLSRNNRSGGRQLAVANDISGPLREAHPQVVPLHPRPDREGDGCTRVALFPTADQEWGWVADDIAQRWRGGTAAKDMAVLLRVSGDVAPVYAALSARDVPVEVVGLNGLLELPEVADLVSTLRVLDEPTANAALLRLLVGPRWRIGVRDLALLGRRARELVKIPGRAEQLSLADGADSDDVFDPDLRTEVVEDLDAALLSAVAGVDPTEVVSLSEALADPGTGPYDPEALARMRALADELTALRRHVGEPVDDLAHRVASTLGLFVEVAAGGGRHRTAALEQFLDVAASFVDLDADPSLTAFLSYLDAATDHERGMDTAIPSTSDSVKLLTVHKAKGLEYPVVYLPDVTTNVFPADRARSSWLSKGAVLPYPLRGDAHDFPAWPEWTSKGVAAYRAACKARERLEELRLAYVALTRAEQETVLTSHWWGPTQKKPRGPSDLLVAVHEHLVAHPEHGEVVQWAPAPDDAINPALATAAEYAWPLPEDADAVAARERREFAAAQVRAAQRVHDEHVALAEQAMFDENVDPDAVTADGSVTSTFVVAGDAGAFDPAVVARLASWRDDVTRLLAEHSAAVAPVREVTVPAALTASQVVRLRADAQGFARDLLRPMPVPPSPAARRGTTFHRWVEERFTRPSLIDLDDLETADQELLDADLAELQSAFLAGPYAERQPLHVEAGFSVAVGPHTVRGRIDAVYAVDPGTDEGARGVRFQVVDWKTGARDADPLQLAVYRIAWAQLAGCGVDEVEAVFYAVRTGEVQRFTDLPDAAALEQLLVVPAT